MIAAAHIEAAFLYACRLEVAALKPGNVHAYADGHRMTVADFEASAVAAAPHVANARLTVGERVLAAMQATWSAVGKNTNLGILLLCAPLAVAAQRLHGQDDAGHGGSSCSARDDAAGQDRLRSHLREVLSHLTIEDARDAFAAITLANPGGLGEAPEADVRGPAAHTLLEAMQLAAPRDLIAEQYATGFAVIFETGFLALHTALTRLTAQPDKWTTTSVYLDLLSRFPDSHITRKHGPESAQKVLKCARKMRVYFAAQDDPERSVERLMAFDRALKSAGLNPGTTADLTVATLFAYMLQYGGKSAA